MSVRRLEIDASRPAPEAIREAAGVLREGGLVAFPTETVYGLGANALDPAAVARIFAAKGRPAYNPLIAHVADASAALPLVTGWPEVADRLAREFWPGPLTLVLRRSEIVPDILTAGLPSVAVRVPAHPVALALLRAFGGPIAAPSANRFTEISPTRAEHVARGLGDRVDLILDAGPTDLGIESTVLDLTGAVPVLLRPGTISRTRIEGCVGPVETAAAVTGDAPRPSPGMVDRHYAPRAELRLVGGGPEQLIRRAEDASSVGRVVGVITRRATFAGPGRVMILPADPAGFAQLLYTTLHEMDRLGCDLILVEQPPEEPEWAGVNDRLRRAGRAP
jgi:L-threonylcarbamoyladenylate synthase